MARADLRASGGVSLPDRCRVVSEAECGRGRRTDDLAFAVISARPGESGRTTAAAAGRRTEGGDAGMARDPDAGPHARACVVSPRLGPVVAGGRCVLHNEAGVIL